MFSRLFSKPSDEGGRRTRRVSALLLVFPAARTDRYNHHEAEDTEDDMDDALFHSFSSCSPRYSRVYLRSEVNTLHDMTVSTHTLYDITVSTHTLHDITERTQTLIPTP